MVWLFFINMLTTKWKLATIEWNTGNNGKETVTKWVKLPITELSGKFQQTKRNCQKLN